MERQTKVVRSDKHTQAIVSMSVADAVNELASIFPASIYDSKLEILVDLAHKGHILKLSAICTS